MCDITYRCVFFFFNDTATTEIYTYLHTLSLHDALPILSNSAGSDLPAGGSWRSDPSRSRPLPHSTGRRGSSSRSRRSEEHTSELQSLMRISYAVFCLKKKTRKYHNSPTSSDRTAKHR